jgi:hypothetical protein
MRTSTSSIIFLSLFLSGCAPLVIGAAAGGVAGGVSSAKASKEEKHSGVTYTGTVLSNVFYFPAKVIFAGGGAIASGLGYVFSGADSSVSSSIWDATVLGDYVITPNHFKGREKVRFVGP